MSAYDGYNPNGYTKAEIVDAYGDSFKGFDIADAEERAVVLDA